MGGVFRQSSLLGKAIVGAPAMFGSKVDPGGAVLGLYGKHYTTPIDPMTSTGIHGWDVRQPAAPAAASTPAAAGGLSYNAPPNATQSQAMTAQRLLGVDQNPKNSTSKLLLGE